MTVPGASIPYGKTAVMRVVHKGGQAVVAPKVACPPYAEYRTESRGRSKPFRPAGAVNSERGRRS